MNKNLPICLLFYSSSFLLFIAFHNWYLVWWALELNTLTFLCLLLLSPSKMKSEYMLTYLIIQSITSLLIIMSLSALTGSLITSAELPSLLLIISMLFKLGAAPLHNWFIPVCFNNNYNLFLALMTMQKIMPFLFLLKLNTYMSSVFIIILMLSAIMGSLLNLKQMSMKMILIFSGISHTSWFLLASSEPPIWKMYFLIYTLLMISILPSMNLSFQTTMLKKQDHLTNSLIFFSLMGVPPLLSFFPKLVLLSLMTKLNLMLLMSTLITSSLLDMFIYSRFMLINLIKKMKTPFWNKKMKMNPISILFLTVTQFILFW